jgi:hypothetical protein
METTLRKNTRYQILTPNGWSDFDGVSKSHRSDIVKITLKDGTILKGTSNHKILDQYDNFIELKDLKNTTIIKTKNGNQSIVDINFLTDSYPVYDPFNVRKENRYFSNDIISHNCNEYLGSSGTLIAGWKLKELTGKLPIQDHLNIKQYEVPIKDHTYVMLADVSRGKGLDYSAIQILDVTEMPYRQVLVFRDNFITPVDFTEILHRFGKQYNTACALIEVNDIGQQVAESLYFDFEYDNILFTESAGSKGKRITQSYKSEATDRGIRTTKTVKSIGCSMLKLLIEQNQLIIVDYDTINELSTFSKKGASYEAEAGCHDDLVMCLVLFAWLTNTSFFKDLTDINTLIKLRDRKEEELENELTPFGFLSDGIESDEDSSTFTFDRDNWMYVDQD